MSTVANLEKNNEIQTFGDNPQSLLTIAIQNGANVEQLEKLLLLKEKTSRLYREVGPISRLQVCGAFRNRRCY
jgi:hypothetical protein